MPEAGLILDSAGNLYGATSVGGASNNGVVFKLDTTRTETVLHSFTGPNADGSLPISGLILDSAGNLYSTTFSGGPVGAGTVFAVDKTTGTERVLYSFTAGADGASPAGRVIGDSARTLYGTAEYGGASGYGVVFKLDKTGETVLYSFTGGRMGRTPGQVWSETQQAISTALLIQAAAHRAPE